jgi:hypothetical protein
MTLSVEQMRKSIKDNQMDYVTIKSIENMDYDKLSMILAIVMNIAPTSKDIFDLIQSYIVE